MIKVYAMNDCDWMAGEDFDSTAKSYLQDYCCVPDTPENREEYLSSAVELTDADLAVLKFQDQEGEILGEPGICTFREALDKMISNGVEFPVFFASTEY